MKFRGDEGPECNAVTKLDRLVGSNCGDFFPVTAAAKLSGVKYAFCGVQLWLLDRRDLENEALLDVFFVGCLVGLG